MSSSIDVDKLMGEANKQEKKSKPKDVDNAVQGLAARMVGQTATWDAAVEKVTQRTYVVQAGDSLSKIAKELLGDAGRWPEIHELNKDQIADPNVIRVGQELKIPAK
jgi:nucleoid-associated protein YgaU